MGDLRDLYRKYNSDKGDRGKNAHHYYLEYEQEFMKKRNDPINILEVGIFKGTSFDAHHEYFPNANLYGIDIFTRLQPRDVPALQKDRVDYIKADSLDPATPKRIENIWGVQFDFIIDDGLHTPDANRITFENLIPLLKDDGIYYIEDAWPLHIMTSKEMSDPWIRAKQDRYTTDKMGKFMKSLDPYRVGEIDLRGVSGRPDSYIFKVRKP